MNSSDRLRTITARRSSRNRVRSRVVRVMTRRPCRVASRAIVLWLFAALATGCVGAGSGGSSRPGPRRPRRKHCSSASDPSPFADPNSYPDAQGDDVSGATQHLASMRADTAAWTAIASHLRVQPVISPERQHATRCLPRVEGAPDALTHVGGRRSRSTHVSASQQDRVGLPHPRRTASSVPWMQMEGRRRHAGDERSREVSDPRPRLHDRHPGGETSRSNRFVSAIPSGASTSPDGRFEPSSTRSGRRRCRPAMRLRYHLVLADGRAVLVSPGHPGLDRHPVGGLRVGDEYDGDTVVVSADRIPYDGSRTFDLLPSGGTGIYWANGIELGSTLSR